MATREFLVGKYATRSANPYVVIREVEPNTNAAPLDRPTAWKLANTMARPLSVRGGIKHGALNIHFRALDGMTTDLGPAKEN